MRLISILYLLLSFALLGGAEAFAGTTKLQGNFIIHIACASEPTCPVDKIRKGTFCCQRSKSDPLPTFEN
jgi:hypothetical protein